MALRVTIESPNGGSYSVTLDEPEVRVGRASFCALRLPYPVVSSHHLTITGAGASWSVTDVGSSNGTWSHGSKLTVGEALAIVDGVTLEIGEVRLRFDIVRERVEGFTLAQSATLLRRLVSESAGNVGGARDDAFFEVLEGPRVGSRYTVGDDVDEAWAGPSAASGLRIHGIEDRAFRIGRDGDGFRIFPGDSELFVNDTPLGPDGHALRSADHVLVGVVRFVWFDPLEPYLDRLDAPVPESAPESKPTPEEPPIQEPVAPPKPRGRSALEWLVIVVSLLIAAAAVAAIVVVLRA